MHIRETTATEPLLNTTSDTGSQLLTKKDKQAAKKRKGKTEKLLANQKARPTRHALAREKNIRPPTVCMLFLFALVGKYKKDI